MLSNKGVGDFFVILSSPVTVLTPARRFGFGDGFLKNRGFGVGFGFIPITVGYKTSKTASKSDEPFRRN